MIRTCLAKDPDERFQNARDLKKALLGAAEGGTAAPSQSRFGKTGWFAAGLFALIAAAVSALYFSEKRPEETRVDIVTPATNAPSSFALSPDGRRIAYAASGDGASRLWVRSLDSASAQPLPGTEGASNPFWAPDSRSLGFFADLSLKRIDIGGGQPQTLAEVSIVVTAQGTWSAGE